MKKVNMMENTKFHGRGTDMTKAIKHAAQILQVFLYFVYKVKI